MCTKSLVGYMLSGQILNFQWKFKMWINLFNPNKILQLFYLQTNKLRQRGYKLLV